MQKQKKNIYCRHKRNNICCGHSNETLKHTLFCCLYSFPFLWRNKKIYSRSITKYDSLTTPITKTCLYNTDPLKPHFYTVKLGFTGVYIIFLIALKNIVCRYSLEPPRWGGSNEYPQSMFKAEMWKISELFIWKFSVFWRWNLLYIWIGMFS